MSDLRQLTELDIRRWVGDPSFGRGQRYFLQGNILNPRRQGKTLRSLCLGSHSQTYMVEVTLGTHGIVSGECSCPVGAGGQCKHAAALLLTWLHQPQAFQELEAPQAALERRSKAELVALILRMVERHPDLEALVELPAAGGPQGGLSISPEVVRRQVDIAFAKAVHNWKDPTQVSLDLQAVVDVGDVYAQCENWCSAAIVYETVARGVLGHYYEVAYDEGEMGHIVFLCTDGLGQCLEATDDPAQREGLLRALFDVYRWDVDEGGYGMGDEVPEIIVTEATAEERRRVAEWVRSALPSGDSFADVVCRLSYGGFLIQLLETELDDEGFLQLCRETGRVEDLVNRLLKLKRVDEAVDEASQAGDYELLLLADVFVSHGHADRAEMLMRQRAPTSHDARLAEWLKTRAEERGDLAEALTLAEALFWRSPSLEAYKEMRKLARKLKRWAGLQTECLTRLREQGEFGLLTSIHVIDGHVDQALETLEQLRRGTSWGVSPWALEVARAAEKSRPRDAIRLYLEEVDSLIAGRTRGNYSQAAQHLLRVRTVHEQIHEQEAWQTLIGTIREKHRRLPALQDELNQVGL